MQNFGLNAVTEEAATECTDGLSESVATPEKIDGASSKILQLQTTDVP